MPDAIISRDVVVIGAGPAGLMAGISAAARGRSVMVLERAPEVCRRFLITGSGAAPVSNSSLDVARFHGRHARFVTDALRAFGPDELSAWFAERNLELHEAEHYGHIVAPGGGEAARDTFLAALEEAGGDLYADVVVTRTKAMASGFSLRVDGEVVHASSLILATGADESGCALAAGFGHSVTPLVPAHVGLRVEESWVGLVADLWMDVRLQLLSGGKVVTEREGSMQFTPGGLAGEVVFNISAEAARRHAEHEVLELVIDFFPGKTRAEVTKWMHHTLGEATRERADYALDRMLPMRLAIVFLRQLKVKPDARSMHIEKSDREGLLQRMTATRLRIAGVDKPQTAESASGGVSVREIDPRTFGSRLQPGLFVVGGLLDVSADWGGFEQHFALASGWVAGHGA
ncbi:MAG: aminoacetone oxidase family FAD-binding enzyme [Planctomycetes bacterium]|nr:aminoacetone oxidase family FAD-binding enzyme [Planctomycetota bacterium]